MKQITDPTMIKASCSFESLSSGKIPVLQAVKASTEGVSNSSAISELQQEIKQSFQLKY